MLDRLRPALRRLGRLLRELWSTADIETLPRWERALVRPLRIARALVRDVAAGEMGLRAMSLVYSTLLSLVPLLAVAFSVLKGLGVHGQLEPFLLHALAPFGEHAQEITDRILGFVENVKAGVLGLVGVAFLFYTVTTLIQKIEAAFNRIWRVTEGRSLARRFSDYLSVLLVGPLLVLTSLAMAASLTSPEIAQRIAGATPLADLLVWLGQIIPFVLIVCAFAFVYRFVPNTRVEASAAFAGALVAGVLWKALEVLFAVFVAQAGNVTAIYSAFASLVLFMIWLDLAWMVLLIGASVAFYRQHPEYTLLGPGRLQLGARLAEWLALHVAVALASDFERGAGRCTVPALAARTRMPAEAVEAVLAPLIERGLVVPGAGDPAPYLPARPMAAIPLAEILDAVRSAEDSAVLARRRLPADALVDRLQAELAASRAKALAGVTLEDLARRSREREAAPAAEEKNEGGARRAP